MKNPVLILVSFLIHFYSYCQDVVCNPEFIESNWTAMGPFDDDKSHLGRVTALHVDKFSPDNIHIGTRGSGIWSTTDGGANWQNAFSYEYAGVGIHNLVEADVYVEGPAYNIGAIYGYGMFASFTNQYDIALMYFDPFLNSWKKEPASNYPEDFIFQMNKTKIGGFAMANRADEYELWLANGPYVFIRNTISHYISPTENYYDWEPLPVVDLDVIGNTTNPDHTIYEIDFAPSNPDRVIISPNNAVEGDFLYCQDVSATTPTWSSIPIPVVTLSGTEDYYEATITTSYITNDAFYSIIRVQTYDSEDPDKHEIRDTSNLCYYEIISSIPVLQKSFPLNRDPVNSGKWVDLHVAISATDDYLFVGDTQHTLFKALIPDLDGTTCLLYVVSNTPNCVWGNDDITHGDIRRVNGFFAPGSADFQIYIATDGGLSKCLNGLDLVNGIENNDKWLSLNGDGLNIADFEGLAVSEIKRNQIMAVAGDGNSWVFNTVNNTTEAEWLVNSCDIMDATISNAQSDLGIDAYNSIGPYGPLKLERYLLDPITDLNDTLVVPRGEALEDISIAIGPFEFLDDSETEHIWAGSNDVYRNYLSAYSGAGSQSDWTEIVKAHETWLDPTSISVRTRERVTAFDRMIDPSNPNKYHVYYATHSTRRVGVTGYEDDTIKLVYGSADYSLATPILTIANISPNTIIGETSGYTQLDHAFITDIEAYHDGTTTHIWVCFGANNQIDWSDSYGPPENGSRLLDYVHGASSNARKPKVYYSPDNGMTWYNRSNGFPNYPVIDLEYLEGSEHIIFAGTGAGVFVWDDANEQWTCFNESLPLACASSIEINYCTMTLKTVLYGYGLWETPLPLGSIYSRAGGQPLEITTDETWTYTRDVGRDIVVKPGATLTIQDCEIRMPKDHRIVVERGAALVLDGATLINHCEPWMGVEVWGNASQEHPLAGQVSGGFYPNDVDDHGVVILKNNSKIENAIVGILAGRRTPEGYDAIYGGGIVIAENSQFINNQIGVQLLPYDFTEFIGGADLEDTDDDNISSFESCTFTTTNQYLIPSVPTAHLYLWDVDGIDILGSSFENERTTLDPLQYGIGIYSTDATFEVNRTFELLEPCTFTYLYRGIEVANTKPFIFIETGIHHAQFHQNIRGVLCSAVQKISILENNFTTSVRDDIQTYGLYLEDCADYVVEENSFTTDAEFSSSLGTAPLTTGIFVANNSVAITEIYNNQFTWIEAGIRSQTVNARLQLKCNQFTTPINPFNIAVTSGGLADQGKCLGGAYTLEERMQAPAGNHFSTDASTDADIKVNNGIPVFKYRHHSDVPYLPVQFDATKVTAQDCGINGAEGDPCPSNLTGGGEESAAMMLAAAESMATAMESLTDLGMAYSEGIDASGGEDAAWLSDLAWLEAEQNALIQDAVDAYLEEGKADSAKIILEQTTAFWAQQQLLQWYMLEKNVSAASSLLKQLPADDQEQIDYATLASMQLNLIPDNRSWKELSEAEMLAVQSLAGKQSPAGVAAENILQLLTGTDYPEVFDIIDGAEELRMAQPGSPLNTVNFYPNPASGQLHIDLSAYPATAELTIKAINIQGVEVWQVVTTAGSIYTCEVAQWPAGIYLFQVMDGNEVIGTEQVVVE